MKEKQFLVALHVQSDNQAIREAHNILTPDGAHGILLVNNGGFVKGEGPYPNLFDIAEHIKLILPDYVVGINPLETSTVRALELLSEHELDILWKDNGGVYEIGSQILIFENILKALHGNPVKYYGGVAFKYQTQPSNLKGVCEVAAKHFSAVITSGDGTGSQPSLEKIRMIREYIGPEAKLGIASGMSVENVNLFLPYADIFIVGTSLCEGDGHRENSFKYVSRKIQNFRKQIDKYNEPAHSY